MSYSNSVLIGNWAEERLTKDYEFMVFLRKRDRRELLLQRSRDLFSNLLKERPLSLSGNIVMFGYNVQVVASDMPPNPLPGKKKGLALSSLVTSKQVDEIQNMADGCLLTLSPILTPCARNTFVILNASDESDNGGKLRYGEEFYLRAENHGDPNAVPLYVRYHRDSIPAPADSMPLHLSATKDTNCRWKVMPIRTWENTEMLGMPVKTNKALLMTNCVADLHLCVMNQNWMKTFFGLECGVTCRNYKNIYGRYCAENAFQLVSDVEKKEQR